MLSTSISYKSVEWALKLKVVVRLSSSLFPVSRTVPRRGAPGIRTRTGPKWDRNNAVQLVNPRPPSPCPSLAEFGSSLAQAQTSRVLKIQSSNLILVLLL